MSSKKNYYKEKMMRRKWAPHNLCFFPHLFRAFLGTCYWGLENTIKAGRRNLVRSCPLIPSLVIVAVFFHTWSRLWNQTWRSRTCSCYIFLIHIYARNLFIIYTKSPQVWWYPEFVTYYNMIAWMSASKVSNHCWFLFFSHPNPLITY